MVPGLVPLAAAALRPIIALSLLGEACPATIEAIGMMFEQLQADATELGCDVVPSTVTFFGSVLTAMAFPSTVIAALAVTLPPTSRLPRMTPEPDAVMLEGVHRVPPTLVVL